MKFNNDFPDVDPIIEIELDSEDIKLLKEGRGVEKETDNPDLPVLFIHKWKEDLVNILYEPDAVIHKKREKYKKEGDYFLDTKGRELLESE